MKQTNNAIKFLMAQYRAIFHNAYFKGLATAAVVTVAMAAGQAQAADLQNDTDLTSVDKTAPIVIKGSGATGDNQFDKLVISGGTTPALGDYTINIEGESTAGDNKIYAEATSGAATLKVGTLNINIDSNSGDKGLLVSGSTDGAATLTVNTLNVTQGLLDIVGGADDKQGKVEATTLTVGNVPEGKTGKAKIQLQKHGVLGKAFATTGDTKLEDLSTITLAKSGTIGTSGAASNDTFTINAGKLDLTGGDLDIAKFEDQGAAAKTSLNVNLVQGAMSSGNIKVAEASELNINFKKALKTGTTTSEAEANTLALTGGSISGAGAIVVSGSADALGTVTLDVKSGTDTTGVDLSAATGDLKIASGAALETSKANLDELKASSLKTTISGGTLKFTDTENITLAKADFADTAAAGTKIGLASNATIAGNILTLTEDLGTATVEAKTLNLGNADATQDEFTDTTVKATSALKVGSDTKIKTGLLSLEADVVKEINTRINALQGLDQNEKNDLIASEILAKQGNFSTVDGVTNGKLTIEGASSKLDIAAGTWNNSNINVVLGGTNEGALNVGAADTALTGQKVATKLVFDGSSKLELASGTVTVGSSTGNELLSAELDISGLTYDAQNTANATLKFTKGSITAEKSGTIKAAQSLIEQIGTDTKVVISSGGTLDLVGDVEIAASKIQSGAGTNNFLAFNGDANNGKATLNAESLKITGVSGTTTGSNVLTIGQYGVLNADELTLDNYIDADKKYGDIELGSGEFNITNTLRSTDAAKTLTLTGTDLTLGKLAQDADDDWYAVTQTGSTNFKYKLGADSKLNVQAGSWNVADINVEANGALTVGSEITRFNGDGDIVGANLTSAKLNNAGTVTVKNGSTAAFTELASTGTLTVSGTLTLAGKHTDYVAPNTTATPAVVEVPESFGVKLDSATVAGADAVLALQSTALQAIESIGKANDTATTATVNYKMDKPSGGAALDVVTGTITVNDWGTLSLDLSHLGESLTLEQIAAVRKEFTGAEVALGAGFIDLNGMKIAGVTFASGDGGAVEIDIDELSKFKDFTDIVVDQLTDATVINVDGSKVVQGNVGNIKANAGVAEVQIGQATLNKGQNGFTVEEGTGKLVNMSVADGGLLGLNNGGSAAKITLADDATLLVKGGTAETKIDRIDGKSTTGSEVVLASGKTTVANGVKVGSFESLAGADLEITAGGLTLSANGPRNYSEFNGNVKVVEGDSLFNHEVELAGDINEFQKLTVKDDLSLINGTTYVKELIGEAGGFINVGAYDATGTETYSYSGALKADLVRLNGADLLLDPAYGEKASVAEIAKFGKVSQPVVDISTIDGNIYVGQNSALLVGANLESARDFIAELQDANGSFDKNDVGSVLYLNDEQVLDGGKQIVVDSALNMGNADGPTGFLATKYNKLRAPKAGETATYTPDLYLGTNSVLALGDGANSALDQRTGTAKPNSAIHFNKVGASIYGEQGATIVLDGSTYVDRDRNVTLFTDADTDAAKTGVMVLENNIRVESLNGMFSFTLEAGKETTGGTLEFNTATGDTAFLDASDPVRYNLFQYATGTENLEEHYFAEDEAPEAKVSLVGDVADDGMVKYDATTGALVLTDKAITYNATAKPEDKIEVTDYVSRLEGADEQGQGGERVIYYKAYNDFLEDVVRNTDGAPAEQAARLGAFGGAVQAALLATGTSYDAVAGRFGMGQQAGTLTVSSNGQGSGMWVTPVYKNYESDGFDADNLTVGADVDLYGLALGGDFTMANGVRVGAMFNIGSGDADGTQESNVSNDFDYFGAAIYAGYSINNFSVVGDITYTNIDSDVEANNELGKITSSFDTTALSVGVTGQYEMAVGGMQVTPHAGLRFTRIDMDDYRFAAADYEDGGEVAQSSINVFSIPVGVTIAKEYVSETWTVKPSFDLTITGNFGDDTIDSDLSWDGVATGAQVSSEFIDSFTYGATVGVAASNGNFGMGIGLNYTGSSNTDEFGVTANARFMF